ncbi:hypothetical protein SDC9_113251 [bioreactor metagenome]|uniref:Uncharacterized protein n=1 Tax=bioreactor metagenome TaxID=1076179 RepID=A0A645BX85_9ZZZZ
MQARFRFPQTVLRPAGDDDFLVADIGFQDLVQADLHRAAFIDCDHIEVIVYLQICIFEQIVEDPFRICFFFQFDNNLQPRAV